MPLNHEDRTIFPMLVNEFERGLLDYLSTECGVSKSEVLRRLLLKEFAQRELARTESRDAVKLKG